MLKVSEKNNLGVLRINHIMLKFANIKQTFAVKLLANTAAVWIFTLYYEHAEHFHISHFTNHLRHFILIDHK